MSNEENKQATILLIEEDDETRPILRLNLQRDGYHVLMALDEEDAMERMRDGAAEAKLIIINLVGKTPEETLEVGRRISHHGRYDGSTPLIVMAEKYGEDLEGTDVHVGENEWITYPEDADQLHNLVARLLGKASN